MAKLELSPHLDFHIPNAQPFLTLLTRLQVI